MKRRLFRALCVSLLAMVCLSGSATVYNGNCGAGEDGPTDKASWSFDSETGELTITGEGALFDGDAPIPWHSEDWKTVDVEDDFYTTLKSVVVGEGITTIPSMYFYMEKALTTVTLPSTLKSIGLDTFAECIGLKTITINATTPPALGVYGDGSEAPVPDNVFYQIDYTNPESPAMVNIATLEKIIVPSTEAVTAYKAADGWKKYSAIIEKAPVVKQDPVVTIMAAENLVYNGAAQNLLTSAQTTGGTLMFSLKANATDADYSTAIPQGQDAKEYTVYYKVKGNDNYNDVVTQSLKVTISPKSVTNPTVELSPKSFEYDGQEHYPTVTVKDGTTVIPTNEYNVDYQTSSGLTVQIKEIGTYTVVVTDKQGGNYTLSKATADFQIVEGWTNDAKITIVANSTEKIYDGTPLTDPKAQVFGLPDGFTINVSVTGSRTDAGESKNVVKEYKIFNSAQEDVTTHFTNVTCADGALVVNPAPLTVWTGSAEKIYDGQPLTCNEAEIRFVSNVDNTTGTDTGSQTGAGAQSESNAEGNTGTATNSQTNAEVQRVLNIIKGIKVTATGSQTEVGSSENTYTIDWGALRKENFTVKEDLGMLTVNTKEVKNPTIELSPMSFVYDGQEHKPTVTVKDGETKLTENTDYTVAYQKDGATATEFKAAGTYTVVISSVEGSNYIVNGSKTFEIVAPQKQDPVVTIKGAENLIYNGEAQNLIASGSTTGGTLMYSLKADADFSTTIPQGQDAKEYTVYYKVNGNDNYKDLATQILKVTIAKQTLIEVNVTLETRQMIEGPYQGVAEVKNKNGQKLVEGQDYSVTYEYLGGEFAESSFIEDAGTGSDYKLHVTGKGNYDGRVTYDFTKQSPLKGKVTPGGGAAITGLDATAAADNPQTITIPRTVIIDGKEHNVTEIADGAFADFGPGTTIDLSFLERIIKINQNSVGKAKVKTQPNQLDDYGKEPNLQETVEEGLLFAELPANYELSTFASGIDINVKLSQDIDFTIGGQTLTLGTVNDITKYLNFYKCGVKDVNGSNEVVATSVVDQMKKAATEANHLKYQANNGVLVAYDEAGVIADIETNLDVLSLYNYMTLNAKAALLKKLGYTASELIRHYNSNPTAIKDKVKKMVMDQFQNRVATLVASYTTGNSAASGDAKSYGEDNMLTPVITSQNYKNGADFTYYALFDRQFKIIADNGSDTPAGKALLKVPTSMVKSGAMARSLTITKGGDETTGIRTTDVTDYTDSDAWYNLNGQRIDQPTKPGIYIYKGKKVRK